MGVCSENAECTNSDGSFKYQCLLGFSGDGLVCSGEYIIHTVVVNNIIWYSQISMSVRTVPAVAM